MSRTQAQREQELQQRKTQIAQELAEAELRLASAEKTLRDKYFPCKDKFKPWALAARAADPKRAITPKEFLRDFFTDLQKLVREHKKELSMGKDTIAGWEDWFLGLDNEDLADLETQMDQAAVPLTAMETK